MASRSAAPSSASLSFSPSLHHRRKLYDVFLSFRGQTRTNFTSHLYEALKRHGIKTFKDDIELERGKSLDHELPTAIEEARCSIIVLSSDYASSKWCLIELAKIVDCMISIHQIVLPVFYHVDPSHVRIQSEVFKEIFSIYDKTSKEANNWRTAMSVVGKLSGWHVKDDYRSESDIVKEIVDRVFNDLRPKLSTSDLNLVGIDSRLHEINKLLGSGLDDVRFIGIWGLGGIGKTTLAEAVYYSLRREFDGSCFLSNIREDAIISLQTQLLSEVFQKNDVQVRNKNDGAALIRSRLCNLKVLLVLDDVDHESQLDYLAQNLTWFGPGSRVIVTARDEHLLNAHGVDYIYEMKLLDHEEALQLFCKHAFKADYPQKDYLDLSNQFVEYSGRLPLALKVLGRFLKGRRVDSWEDELQQVKNENKKEIHDVLKRSYDGLELTHQQIFLDIACFFKGMNKNRVIEIFKACDFYPVIGLDVLNERCFITESNNKIWMHALVQQFGREIVRRMSPDEPCKRSRLWCREDVNSALSENQKTQAIEGIVLDFNDQGELYVDGKSLSKMSKIRLLEINNVVLSGDLESIPVNNLRLLNWHGYPLEHLPSRFQAQKLFELHMHSSCIKELWEGTKKLDKLKVIDLCDSKNLSKTPNLEGVPNLEVLVLYGCIRLSFLHPSTKSLKKLLFLNLKDCKSLVSFTFDISWESLTTFILSGCSNLVKFPHIVGNMEHLLELHLDGTAIEELHSSVGCLNGLVSLNLRDCKRLRRLPDAICNLVSLRTLILYGCSKLDNIPQSLGNLECLELLDLSKTSVTHAPSSIQHLNKLQTFRCKGQSRRFCHSLFPPPIFPRQNPQHTIGFKLTTYFLGYRSIRDLDLSDCNLVDGDIPKDLGCFSSLEVLDLSGNHFVTITESICQLTNLKKLLLIGCIKLQRLPKLPPCLGVVEARDCISLKDYYNKEVRFPSSEAGWTVINCLISAESQNFKVEEIKLSSIHNRVTLQRNIEMLAYQREEFGLAIRNIGVLDCFDHQTNGCSITFNYDGQESCNQDKRIGIVFAAAYEHENLCTPIPCNFFVGIETNEFSDKFTKNIQRHYELPPSARLWVVHIPFAMLPDWFSRCSSFEISLTIDNPIMKIIRCGATLLYERIAPDFLGKLINEAFGDPPCFDLSIINHMLKYPSEGGFYNRPGWISTLRRAVEPLKVGPIVEPDIVPDRGTTSTSTFTSAESQCCESDSIIMLRRNLKFIFRRFFEDPKPQRGYYIFPGKRISQWFDHQFKDRRVTVKLPQNLHKDKKWMGIVVFAVFKMREHSQVSRFFNYRVECNEFPLQRSNNFHMPEDLFDGSHQLWVFYERCTGYPWQMNKWTHISFSFQCQADIEVVCSGRLVYEQNVEGLAQAMIDSVLGSPHQDFHDYYNQAFVQKYLRLIRSERYEPSKKVSRKKVCACANQNNKCLPAENIDHGISHLSRLNKCLQEFFSRCINDRYGSNFDFVIPGHKIPRLFTNQCEEKRIELDITPRMRDDRNWVGFVICALIHVNRPTAVINNLDPKRMHRLLCQFIFNMGHLDKLYSRPIFEDKVLWVDARRFLWLFYIPRKTFSTLIRHNKNIVAVLETDSPELVIGRTALHQTRKFDTEEIDTILKEFCSISPSSSSSTSE